MPAVKASPAKRHKSRHVNDPIIITNPDCPVVPLTDELPFITIDEWYTDTKYRWHSEMDEQYGRMETDKDDAERRVFHARFMVDYYTVRNYQVHNMTPPSKSKTNSGGYDGDEKPVPQLPKDLMPYFQRYFASRPHDRPPRTSTPGTDASDPLRDYVRTEEERNHTQLAQVPAIPVPITEREAYRLSQEMRQFEQATQHHSFNTHVSHGPGSSMPTTSAQEPMHPFSSQHV
ncbi:hypothetical protein CcaverHIS002_0703680 [Cutaneotrichosporon cavernicola]|nr:hypothetical protein CcaverHIS002_0703680 [Cutaneotrichosporon cavernicola]